MTTTLAIQSLSLSQRLDASQPPGMRQQALVELVDDGAEPLRRFLLSRHVAPAQLMDLINDTWVVVIKKVNDGAFSDRGKDPIDFVLGIAAKLLLRAGAAPVPEIPLHASADLADGRDAYADSDAAADVAHATAAIDNAEEQFVLEAFIAGQSLGEIAEGLGCSYKTVWRRFHRAIDRCRATLDPSVGASHAALA